MKPITAVLAIASTTLVLTGCDSPQDRQQAKSIFQAFGVTDLVSGAASPAPAVVAYVEPEAPAPVWEEHCWTEWHRAGTMEVRVCENRLVTP
jgi:hypothetical protein